MPHGNVHALRAVHQLQKAHHIVKIVQRLANAHQHDVGNGQARVHLREQHLVQHFIGLQPPHQSADGGGAKGAAHAAAHLRGNAHGVPVVIAHQHRLHAVAVGQFPEVFDRAVPCGFLPAHHLRGADGILPRQGVPEGLGQVRHFVIGADALVQPGVNLFGAERRLPQFFQNRRQLRQGHGFQIHAFLRRRQIKKPSVSYSPGIRVSIPVSFLGNTSGSGSGSVVNSPCAARNAETTSSFSRFNTVQVEYSSVPPGLT